VEDMELTAFTMISNVGTAKSLIMEALYAARESLFEEAEAKLQESGKYLVEGHKAHAGLIQKEASGEKLEFSLLIMHAEDQMMSAETIKDLVTEMIHMYREMKTVKGLVSEIHSK
jgi:cellobiose PTS system EIIA component